MTFFNSFVVAVVVVSLFFWWYTWIHLVFHLDWHSEGMQIGGLEVEPTVRVSLATVPCVDGGEAWDEVRGPGCKHEA